MQPFCFNSQRFHEKLVRWNLAELVGLNQIQPSQVGVIFWKMGLVFCWKGSYMSIYSIYFKVYYFKLKKTRRTSKNHNNQGTFYVCINYDIYIYRIGSHDFFSQVSTTDHPFGDPWSWAKNGFYQPWIQHGHIPVTHTLRVKNRVSAMRADPSVWRLWLSLGWCLYN